MIVRHNLSFLPAGIMLLGVILVKEKYARPSLIAHEMVHVKQLKANPVLFYPRYLLSRKWKLRYETEAYAESVRMGDSLYGCAEAMSGDLYRNMVSYEQAIDLLLEELGRAV